MAMREPGAIPITSELPSWIWVAPSAVAVAIEVMGVATAGPDNANTGVPAFCWELRPAPVWVASETVRLWAAPIPVTIRSWL